MSSQLSNWKNTDESYQHTIRKKIIGYDLIYDLMLDSIRTQQQVQDILIVGAGGGQELQCLGAHYPNASFVAVDASPTMIQIAKSTFDLQALHITWYEQDCLTFNTDQKFDVITCHLLMHFLPTEKDKQQLLSRLHKQLKKGGRLYLSLINDSAVLQEQLSYWQHSMQRVGMPPTHFLQFAAAFGVSTHPTTVTTLQDMIIQAGFSQTVPYFKTLAIDAFVLYR